MGELNEKKKRWIFFAHIYLRQRSLPFFKRSYTAFVQTTICKSKKMNISDGVLFFYMKIWIDAIATTRATHSTIGLIPIIVLVTDNMTKNFNFSNANHRYEIFDKLIFTVCCTCTLSSVHNRSDEQSQLISSN